MNKISIPNTLNSKLIKKEERKILTKEEFEKFKQFVNSSEKEIAREVRNKMQRIDERSI